MHEVKVINLALDPSLFDFSFPYIPPSSELCPVNSLETDQQLGQHSAPQPNFLDYGLGRENQLVSPEDVFIDRSAWLPTGSDLHQLDSLLPEVSNTMADGTSATEPDVSAQEPEPTKPGFSQGVSEQTNTPSSDRTGLPRRRSRYLIRQQHEQSGPIFIPNTNAMDPMERWRESPPEDEPASISAILDALRKTPTQRSTQRSSRPDTRNTGHNAFRHYRRAPSATSGESSGSSNASFGSALSHSPSDDPSSHHLVQHLRLVHNVDTLPLIDDWKISHSAVPSRCGFCEHSMDTWEQRVDHLAEHFRKNATMKDWKGDHGFPPSIAAQVTNSLPPYLIAEESQSQIPFSATNTHVQDHFAQISSRAHYLIEEQKANPDKVAEDAQAEAVAKQNISMSELSSFTQVLTLHLSRYAQEKIKQGVMPTDDMFQQEARRVLYDSEDSWNQTIADNPEWLSAFRHLHCADRNNIETERGGVDRHLEDTPQTGMGMNQSDHL
ncbi:unnamed protein product [Aspergillus oryzae]|nr:unnamed protein product [Aspergillus oryzae]GMF92561.1 unnamed protein product [Aspergillus oryzae]